MTLNGTEAQLIGEADGGVRIRLSSDDWGGQTCAWGSGSSSGGRAAETRLFVAEVNQVPPLVWAIRGAASWSRREPGQYVSVIFDERGPEDRAVVAEPVVELPEPVRRIRVDAPSG